MDMEKINIVVFTAIMLAFFCFFPLAAQAIEDRGTGDYSEAVGETNYMLEWRQGDASDRSIKLVSANSEMIHTATEERENMENNQEENEDENERADIPAGYFFLLVIWLSILYAVFVLSRMRSKKENNQNKPPKKHQ